MTDTNAGQGRHEVTECLSLLGIVVISSGVTANFTTDRAAVEAQLPTDLALAHA